MNRTCRSFSLVVVFFAVQLSNPVWSQDEPDRILSPYFVVSDNATSTELFPLKSTRVAATITGVIAEVFVTQIYTNEGSEPIDARYVFPASTRASFHGMTFKIDDQVVVARIERRHQAKAEFQKARTEGKSASLLEQQRPNVFTMNVANILPGDTVEVELHYTELQIPTEGTYEFHYPSVVGPRYKSLTAASSQTGESSTSPHLTGDRQTTGAFDINVTLCAGLPAEEVRSSSHPVDVTYDTGDVVTVALKDKTDFGGDRDFILEYRLSGERIQSGLLLHQGETENFFLLMVQPPERYKAAEIAPREYLFIVDVSGSMSGFPLDTAKLLVSELIGRLRETDRFNVVLFAGGSRVMAPTSQPATPENAGRAIRLIEEQRGGGGTELVPALGRALNIPRDEAYARTVVIITDGYIEADREIFEIVSKNLGETNFFSFGIGSSVNRHLIEGIARAGQGEPFIVTRPEEAKQAAERFSTYIESPLLTNLRVTYRGFDAYDVEPPALPDLFAQRPIILFGKWRGSPNGEIEITGNSVTGPYIRTFRVADTKTRGDGALRYLWARARVARLSDLGFGNEDPAIENEVTELGLSYSLLTKNTSFIAVMEHPRTTRVAAKDVDQPLPLPQGMTAMSEGGAYAAGSEPELWLLLVMVVTLIALLRSLR